MEDRAKVEREVYDLLSKNEEELKHAEDALKWILILKRKNSMGL